MIEEPIVHNKKKALRPRFIDGDGNFYDKFYNKIEDDDKDIYISDDINAKVIKEKISKLASEKPDPYNYDNYFEYEKAMVEWKDKIERVIGSIKLPQPVGRYYYRPKFIPLLESMSF